MTRARTPSWPLVACLALGGLHFLLWLWVAGSRLSYPFDIEWMEGGQLTHAVRLLQGKPIYARPSADFVAFFYTPLYPALVALGSKLSGGVTYALGRGVSVVATLVTFGLLFAVVRREAGARFALLAVGVYAGLDRFAGTFTSVARADALSLSLAFAGVVAARYGRATTSAATAALLAVLAVFAKQTMVVLGIAVAFHLLLTDRRRGLVFTAVAGLAGTVGSLWLERTSGGWFSFYIASGHQSHAFYWQNLAFFFWRDVLFLAPVLLLVPLTWLRAELGSSPLVWLLALHLLVAFIQRALTLDYPPHMYFRELSYESPRFLLLIPPVAMALLLRRFFRSRASPHLDLAGSYWPWMFVAALVASAIGHSTQWAYKNAFMPLALFGALFLSLALKSLAERGIWAERAVAAALALQLVIAFDAPTSRLPTAADRAKVAALRARVAKVDGPLLALAHPLLSYEHDGRVHLHQMGLSDVAAMGGVDDFERRASEHAWAAVVTDTGDGIDIPAPVRTYYAPAEAFDGPEMKTGFRCRPAHFWLPKPR